MHVGNGGRSTERSADRCAGAGNDATSDGEKVFKPAASKEAVKSVYPRPIVSIILPGI